MPFIEQDKWELAGQKPADKDEQNPAWSVLDFRTWQYIVSDVLTKKDGIGQYLDSGECKNIAKYMQEEWSKKLSIKQNPAWSEEDESKRICACKFLDDAKHEINYAVNHKDDIDECITWLKTLKERYTWKPSDEQIETLNEVIKEAAKMGGRLSKYNKVLQTLKSLYNDLKELKG